MKSEGAPDEFEQIVQIRLKSMVRTGIDRVEQSAIALSRT